MVQQIRGLTLLFFLFLSFACGKSYDDLLKEGMGARAKHKWSEAKKLFFAAAEKDPTAEVYKELGNVYLLSEQNLEEAESYYKKSLAIDPNYINAQFNMAVVTLKKYDLTLDNKGKGDNTLLAEAKSWFDKVYAQNPNFSIGIEEFAKYHYYRHDFKSALDIAHKAIVVNSRNANAYSIIGQIYYVGLKDYKQAIDNFQQAHAFNNQDIDVVFFLWATSEKLNRVKDAKEYKDQYEQMLKDQGFSDADAKFRIKRLENQLRG